MCCTITRNVSYCPGTGSVIGIIFFSFFYTAVVFNPEETSENLKRAGGFIPGIRPGKNTETYLDYAVVTVNNESWRDALAAVPFERRLLLMPKCLREENRCPAPFDEFGLLCKQCGLCTIQDLTAEAEKLGYAVLVARGADPGGAVGGARGFLPRAPRCVAGDAGRPVGYLPRRRVSGAVGLGQYIYLNSIG